MKKSRFPCATMSFDNEDVHEIKYFDPSYNGNVMIVLLSAQSPHP